MIPRLDKKHDTDETAQSPSGQVRVLVVGDPGIGKTSLVHLILNGKPDLTPRRTVGCSVEVKHITCPTNNGSSPNSLIVGNKRDFFVELWDLSGHDRYKDCRSLFYSQINGVIFVHDLSQRKTKVGLQRWAAEIAARGTFSVPMSTFSAAGIPVPFLVIGNKADLVPKHGGSSGNLVDVARHWVEKQGFLSPGDELPVTEGFPGSGGLVASATEGRLDLEAVKQFFCSLIRRRYLGEEITKPPVPKWSNSTRNTSSYHSRGMSLHDDDVDEDDNALNSYTSSNGAELGAQYTRPDQAAQFTLMPPPSSYLQQPFPMSEIHMGMRTSSSLMKSSSWISNSSA